MHFLTLASLLPLGALAAPLLTPRGLQVIPGSYIIKLKDGASDGLLHTTIDGLKSIKPSHVYRAGKFKGFSAKLDAKTLAAIKDLPEVRHTLFLFLLIWHKKHPLANVYVYSG